MSQVWKIAPGEHADHWDMCRDKGCILIGWRSLKDYRKFDSVKAVERAMSGEPGDGAGAARSVWHFYKDVQPDDVVVANHGRSGVVGIGIINSDYLPPGSSGNPSESVQLPNARLVDWVIIQPIQLAPYFFNIPTVQRLGTEKIKRIQLA